jgi:porphobilinogen synthase
MPGVKRWGLNKIVSHLAPLVDLGLKSVLIFGVQTESVKDATGTSADSKEHSPVLPAIRLIRKTFPKLLVACDVCLCGYTNHGHCGILTPEGIIDNPKSVERLAEISLNFALAGCQVIAPSDMMDGRILAIKNVLKKANLLNQVPVLSYAAKFSSCFYGPFRNAASSAPAFGDRKAYQIPSGSTGLAMRAVDRDVAEGADFLMVKPALAYLDIIQRVKQRHPELPMFAYQVSGEYSMLIEGAKSGLFNLDSVLNETLGSLRRAGTDVIITYFTPRILQALSTEAKSN